jgi:CRISPR-associated endonuclease/helicase Cas3
MNKFNHYIAHIRKSDKEKQTVFQHNNQVGDYASVSAKNFELAHIAKLAGKHHDDGKNTAEFYDYITAAADGKPVVRGSVIHSTHGAVFVNQLAQHNNLFQKLTAEIARTVIMSHHGIKDCVTSEGDLIYEKARQKIENSYPDVSNHILSYYTPLILNKEFSYAVNDIEKTHQKIMTFVKNEQNAGLPQIYWSMYIRLLTSIIIDADRTDTACFEDNTPLPEIPLPAWEKYLANCEKNLKELSLNKTYSVLDQYREEISQTCANFDKGESGIFRLVIPCGAGKTLSALRYALHTAERYRKNHIFYIAPYNSILEQNAAEIKKYTEDEAVLVHHSDIVFDADDGEDESKYKLLTENWLRVPIIATSAVQFLNTLFASKTSNMRRMHALGNSVIILDEIQSLPTKITELFNVAINFLAHFCNSAVILCSATQPTFEKLNHYRLSSPVNIIPDYEKYTAVFKRTGVLNCIKGNGFSTQEAANFILEKAENARSVLAIVNTKPCARNIFKHIREITGQDESVRLFHLSTNMCPAHREQVLSEMRACLDDKNTSQKIICITTTLIEAGVDISFECVVRSLTGLDSIVQAAGRCNRHKETECGIIYLIYVRDEKIAGLGNLAQAQQITREILYHIKTNPEKYPDGLFSEEAIREYYKEYFKHFEGQLAYPLKNDAEHTLIDLLTTNPTGTKNYGSKAKTIFLRQAFKEAAEAFCVIEDNADIDVIVAFNNDATSHIKKLMSDTLLSDKRKEVRQLQRYTIHLQSNACGMRFEESEGIYILDMLYYNNDFGYDADPILNP